MDDGGLVAMPDRVEIDLGGHRSPSVEGENEAQREYIASLSEASARVSSPPRPFVFIGLHTGCEIGMLVNMKNERLFSKRLDCRELSFHPSIIPTLLLGAAAL